MSRKDDLIIEMLNQENTIEETIKGFRDLLLLVYEEMYSADEMKKIKETLDNLFTAEELQARLLPVYDKYFTEEELVAILDFMKSPAGNKYLGRREDLLEETRQLGTKWGDEVVAALDLALNSVSLSNLQVIDKKMLN